MTLGFQIARRMQDLGLTQLALATRAGLTQQSISHYIRGASKPNYDSIVALSEALEVHPIWFFMDHVWDPSAPSGLLRRTFPSPYPEVTLSTSGVDPDQRLVIGHWLPMQTTPSPINVHVAGIVAQFYGLIFGRLVKWVAGRPYGDLAIDWKAMGNRWVFQLRGGVRFHDGTPLTAEDVCWSYETYLAQNPQDHNIEGVSVLDGQFVQLYLRENAPLGNLAMPYILPAGSDEGPPWAGTGPFRAVDIQPGHWRLSANPHYYASEPYLREVEIKEYESPEALREALIEGEVQFVRGVHVPGEGLVATAESSPLRYQLEFRLQHFPTNDVVFRRAVAQALDRGALAEAAGLKQPLFSAGPFDIQLNDRSVSPPPRDPEALKQYVEQNPRIRETTIRVFHYSMLPQTQRIAEAIVNQLQAMGLKAVIGEPSHILVVNRGLADLHLESRHWLSDDRYNLSGYSNPSLDIAIKELHDSPPMPGQLLEIRRLIARDLPNVPLFYDEIPFSYVSRLHTLEDNGSSLERLHAIHLWYLGQE